MKTTFASNVMLADFIRAEAGIESAVFDNRLAVLYTAYYHILKSGNKTQWNAVQSACALYADIAKCKEALDSARITPAVKRMHAVYLAYGAAVAQVGIPAIMKGADHEALDTEAAKLASEFASTVTVALTPEAKPVLSDEEKAKAKAEKEKAKAKAEKEAAKAKAAEVQAEAEKIAQASVVTLADMVTIVANAIRLGKLDAEALAVLDGALDSVAVTTAYVPLDAETLEQVAA